MEPNYKAEFFALIGFIVSYAIVAVVMSAALNTLLGNIVFFTVAGLPFYLVSRVFLYQARKYSASKDKN